MESPSIQVLDHGYVQLLRVDGDDQFLAQTARTSTDTKATDEQNARLVQRLVRDRHTSPIEFGGLVFQIQMPIFVARQWMRHRTGAFNEFSGRYSEFPDLYYLPAPERIQAQSTFNKQGSAEQLSPAQMKFCRDLIVDQSESAYRAYQGLLKDGLTRELARMVLPTNFYTKVRWKLDLHNLFHFLKLREDPHAQWEIIQYANVIHKIVLEHFPIATKAFEDHIQNQITVSPEVAELLATAAQLLAGPDESTNSELQEFMRKYGVLRYESVQ